MIQSKKWAKELNRHQSSVHPIVPHLGPGFLSGMETAYTGLGTLPGQWPSPLNSVAYLEEAKMSRQGAKCLFFSCAL